MKSKTKVYSWAVLAALTLSACGGGSEVGSGSATVSDQKNSYVIDVNDVVAEVQPTMYGIFFEDINFAADGGLYAELIKNGSFEFDEPLMGWEQPASDRFSMNDASGFATAINKVSDDPNSRFLRVEVKSPTGYVLTNSGFRGMGIKEGNTYNLTFNASVLEGKSTMNFELLAEDGSVLGSTKVTPSGGAWKEYKAAIKSSKTDMKGTLRISFEGAGKLDIDLVSLFPEDTWMNRPRGLRADLVQKLADLKPGFLRFPGGCIVEGRTLAKRYQWKKTVGDIEDREMLINRWNTEFAHRLTPDYYQSFGIGFFEYFQLSEDLGAEPLPILGCGMACQFNTGELVPMDEMEPYVQDALDLIEFANGPITSPWGKVRAEMGHPEPFNMKYIGVGNEQWGPEYIKRYKLFEDALKAEYPEIIIISGSGPYPDGEMFEYGWDQLKDLKTEIVDEHYYRPPNWFLENADRYDSYDRNGPKVFAGEYAAQSVAIASPDNKNNWNCALSEAAFMTGLERNADLVTMTSYAPLMAHAEGWQWTPDLIWFNNLESYGTANYYVQKLFSNNAGTHLVTLKEDNKPVIGAKGLYASAVLDKETGEVIVKIVNNNESKESVDMSIKGLANLQGKATMEVISAMDPDAVNSFSSPENISPELIDFNISGTDFSLEVEPKSLSVIRIKSQEILALNY
ncbi:MAG: alpha-L-arabinofuranosidase [Cytophagia bacterium]|nr:alpha-L-arabinofuranosidase [Cytophagia bacterium]